MHPNEILLICAVTAPDSYLWTSEGCAIYEKFQYNGFKEMSKYEAFNEQCERQALFIFNSNNPQ